MTLTKQQVEEALQKVIDPEINLDIFNLGLIYNIEIKESNDVIITMTLTSPMCPYAPEILGNTKKEVKEVGANDVQVDLTFDPPWEPNDDVKMMLGLL